ncbi:AmmeMemoRadiSam system radical SAM enzyme [Methanosphaera sp.]
MNKCDICPNNCDYDTNSICQQSPIYDDENAVETSAIAIDPIEKKPLYHFMPGTQTLSIGTVGCNLKCINCQNHTIAQPENAILVPIKTYTPEEIVQQAIDNDLESISWTYNEPTIHPKWIISTAKIAKKYDIKTILVTNGYTSQETLDKLVKYVDAVNVDIKSMEEEFYKDVCVGTLEPVLNSIKYYVKQGVHTEVTNLLIPGYNDSTQDIRKIISFIGNTSDKIHLHFTRFYPQFKLNDIEPTREKTIYKACDLAQYLGIKYTYPGNIESSYKDNTYCKNCRHILIERNGYEIKNHVTKMGGCPNCSHKADVYQE